MISHFIKFTEQNNTGIIKLNRPDALNALNYEMAVDFLAILSKWKKSNSIKRVLLLGEGKAFCAGGDVKSLFSSSNKNTLKETFFQKHLFSQCFHTFLHFPLFHLVTQQWNIVTNIVLPMLFACVFVLKNDKR